MNHWKLTLSSCLCAAMFVAGCAVQPPTQSAAEHKLPDPGPDQQYRVVFPDLGRGKARYIHVTIGGDVYEACGLVRAHFDFDSAEPMPQDKLFLKSVAECLNQPSLRDKAISIVGRADSRGSADYNLNLGLKRADAVKQLLTDAGVSADRISTGSNGDIGAHGGDDKLFSYGYDRRVDVVVIGVVQKPH